MKKFYLIDASDLKSGNLITGNNTNDTDNSGDDSMPKTYQERTRPLITKEMHHIDAVMSEVLNNDLLSEEEKVREYNKALTVYQQLKSTKPLSQISATTIKIPVTEKSYNPSGGKPLSQISATTSKIPVMEKSYNPTSGISPRYKEKANELWSILNKEVKLSLTVKYLSKMKRSLVVISVICYTCQ